MARKKEKMDWKKIFLAAGILLIFLAVASPSIVDGLFQGLGVGDIGGIDFSNLGTVLGEAIGSFLNSLLFGIISKIGLVDVELPDTDIPPETSLCENIDLYASYCNTFGTGNMTLMGSACEFVHPGGWTARSDKVGCYVNGAANLSCPGSASWATAPASWKASVLLFKVKCDSVPGTVFSCSEAYLGCEC